MTVGNINEKYRQNQQSNYQVTEIRSDIFFKT
jgi:hypothetical protein